MWYTVSVPEAAVLRVTVVSTDTARYQPVVTVLDPGSNDEVACGLAAARQGRAPRPTRRPTSRRRRPTATPGDVSRARGPGHQQLPLGGLPTLTVRFAGTRRDAAAHRRRRSPGKVQPEAADALQRRRARRTSPPRSIRQTAHWEFHEKINGRDVVKTTRRACGSPTRGASSGRARRRLLRQGPRGQREHVPLHDVRAGHRAARCLLQPATSRCRARTGCGSSSRRPSRCTLRLLVTAGRPPQAAAATHRHLLGRRLAHALDPAERRRRQGPAGDRRHRARPRGQCHAAAAMRRRPRDRPGQLHFTVTLPSQPATDA